MRRTCKVVFRCFTSSAAEDDNAPQNLKSALHMTRQNSLLTVQKKQAITNPWPNFTVVIDQRFCASVGECHVTDFACQVSPRQRLYPDTLRFGVDKIEAPASFALGRNDQNVGGRCVDNK